MSIPQKSAFQVLTATEYNQLVDGVNNGQSVQSNSSTSASAAVGAGATAVLTIVNCVLAAGFAYEVENIGGALGSTALEADFSLWKTSTAGTQIGAFYRTPCVAGGAVRNCYGKIYVKRSAVTPLTLDMVLAVAASTGTVTHEAAANRPRALVVRPVGLSADFSFAFDVT